jgi:TolB-like protein/cytochrome c-type biogenesis protein CcmH/NrfG
VPFFEELKRRNVFRVGIAYLIASWLILQVIDVVVPILELPNWISRAILLFLAVGFIVSLILAWAYEVTPDGVKREEEVDRSESITPQTGRKLDFIIIGVLGIAPAIFALDKFVWSTDPVTDVIASAEERTIAVLPFVNMSDDSEQEYFSDGLTEELLNLLARVPQLRVTSRSSAFYYKGKDLRIADVGRELGVAHILEGSVRRSGDTIRITAQLIEVESDAHVWSDTWDRTFADIFEIQDEIAQAVVSELRIRLSGDAPRAADTDPNAYGLYLRSRHMAMERSVPNFLGSLEFLEEALDIDPEFAAAWIQLGNLYVDGRAIGMFTLEEATTRSREAANRALALDPTSGDAHLLLAFIASNLEVDRVTSMKELNRALELAPNDVEAIQRAAFQLSQQGRVIEAAKFYERLKVLDPVNVNNWYSVGLGEMAANNLDEAESAFRKAIELAPKGIGNYQRLAWVLMRKGQFDAALEAAEQEVVDARRTSVRALTFQSMGDTENAVAEHEKLIAFGERWTYEIARMYAYRGMADEAFHWLDRSIARADGSLWFVGWDPFLDNIRDDSRFAAIEKRVGVNQE